jgi:Domain of unknown function (DUF4214)/RTX calcium-binding nonapeptide repeat (4 copies)
MWSGLLLSRSVRALFGKGDRVRGPRASRPCVERLEDRCLLDANGVNASVVGNRLVVTGSSGDDSITLRIAPSGSTSVTLSPGVRVLEVDSGNGSTLQRTFFPITFNQMVVDGGAGNDTITIDESNGAFTDTIATTLIGGAGNDSITGGTGGEVFPVGPGNDTINGGSGNDTYTFDTDVPLGSLVIDSTGTGNDTLDFSQTTSVPVTLNLSSTLPQQVNANLNLTLLSAGAIAAFRGTQQSDTISLALTGAPDESFVIDGQSPVLPTQPGDTLVIDASSVPTARAVGTGPDSGLLQVNGRTVGQFVSIETFSLKGNSQADLGERYVTAVFKKLLNRLPDQGELQFWRSQLDAQISQPSRLRVAEGIWNTNAHHQREVQTFLATYFPGQPVDPSVVAGMAAQLDSGALNEGQVLAKLVTTPTFRRTARKNRSFINKVLGGLFGTPTGLAGLGSPKQVRSLRSRLKKELDTHGRSRALLVQEILSSPAALRSAATDYIQTFLGRPPASGEVDALASQIRSGGLTPLQAGASVLASDPFFALVQSNQV